MVSLECLAEAPACGRHVVRRQRPAVAGGHSERQALPVQLPVALPVLAPIPAHGHPSCLRALDGHRRHVSRAAHVGDEHQVEVGVAVDGEADAALLGAGHAAVEHRHDAAAVHPDLLERRLRHVEVLPRRVAPAAGVAGLGGVGRAEVGGGDHHAGGAAANAPLGVGGGVALDLEAGAAAESGVEERGAEGGGVSAIARAVEVSVAAGTAHGTGRISAAIEGGVGGGPAAGQGLGGSRRRGHEENGGGAHGHGHEEENEIV